MFNKKNEVKELQKQIQELENLYTDDYFTGKPILKDNAIYFEWLESHCDSFIQIHSSCCSLNSYNKNKYAILEQKRLVQEYKNLAKRADKIAFFLKVSY